MNKHKNGTWKSIIAATVVVFAFSAVAGLIVFIGTPEKQTDISTDTSAASAAPLDMNKTADTNEAEPTVRSAVADNTDTAVAVPTSAVTGTSPTSGNSGTSEAGVAAGTGNASPSTTTASLPMVTGGALDTADMFTDRDLKQTPDLSGAKRLTVEDSRNIEITTAGTYVISGAAKNATIFVNASDDDKVQLVLDGVTITNDSTPCIYAKSADKVFVTTTDSENALAVTGTFTKDGNTKTDAVIFSKDDLVLNGVGILTIQSSDNGISGKDDLKVTGGTINITCAADALEANDSIRIAGGEINITTDKDGLHAENDKDQTVGFVYICGGVVRILSGDDGIHATTVLQIDSGEVAVNAHEGLEATWVQINGGNVLIQASDDGINAAYKSAKIAPAAEFNGGTVTIVMGSGDTDAIDSNGNLIITGGTLDITAQFPFDYDGTCKKTGGTLIINGEETDEVTNQFFGGPGGHGGFGGHGGWGR